MKLFSEKRIILQLTYLKYVFFSFQTDIKELKATEMIESVC